MRVPRSFARSVALALSAASLAVFASTRLPAQHDSTIGHYVREAERGNASARRTLGLMLAEGGVMYADPAGAVRWLLPGAAAGDVEAQVALAGLYLEGRGVERDPIRAAFWYRDAAPRSPYAALRLGQLFEAGDGVPCDSIEAVRLYRRAADAGVAAAQNSLGNLYVAGIGVARDYSEAREWYRKAAGNGYADALLNLAGLYYHGLGVSRDYLQAFALAQAAAQIHAHDAAPFLREIERKMAETEKPAPH